ncbi:MAG: helix-turn-helix transcriptional regulator [Clostridia bacterium]|nr:helix-turn-helix transcriptional regulator [Clostridia bacterium]
MLRKRANKTQSQMAKLLNIAQTTYSKYELGTAEPNIQTINQLAKIFNCDVAYLVADDVEVKDNRVVVYGKNNYKEVQLNEEEIEVVINFLNLIEKNRNHS